MIITRTFGRFYSSGGTSKTLLSSRWIRNKYSYVFTGFFLSGLTYYGYSNWIAVYKQTTELSREHFTKYNISYKKDVDADHFLMELTPVVKQSSNLWKEIGSSKIWSVQVKQPEIMVVRNYTPLPLQYNEETNDIELIKDGENADGKLFFYLKQYNSGEVARWLHSLRIGQTVELRGPYFEYNFPNHEDEVSRNRSMLYDNSENRISSIEPEKFKYQPFNLLMFSAGTGIVPALQLLLTEAPFPGFVHLFYSCHDKKQLGPLYKYLDILDQNKRISLHIFESAGNNSIKDVNRKQLLKRIPEPIEYKGLQPYSPEIESVDPVLSLVCGPDSFITTVSGEKYDFSQGPIEGLLKEKGWTNENVYKMT